MNAKENINSAMLIIKLIQSCVKFKEWITQSQII